MSQARLYISNSVATVSIDPIVQIQSADTEHFLYESFGITEARSLQQRAYLKPSVREQRDFLISFSAITVEAQNALLKLFEEPPLTSVFHIVIPREDLLLQTLRSRLHLVEIITTDVDSDVVGSFMRSTYGERIEEIAKRTKAKDMAWIEAIAFGIESYANTQKDSIREESMRSIIFVRQYLGSRGASAKMLLEELALSLPQIR